MKSGIEHIFQERMSQLDKHNWTPDHDDTHRAGQLAIIAATLCVWGTDATVEDPEEDFGSANDPWGLEQKLKGDPIHRLKVAGALIAAEIDRLQRCGIYIKDTDR